MNRRMFFTRATQVAGIAAIASSLFKEAMANPVPVEIQTTVISKNTNLTDELRVCDDSAHNMGYDHVCFIGCSAVTFRIGDGFDEIT